VRAAEKLTAFLEPGSGPSIGTPRGDFCKPWRDQPAARLNRRAATPNAVKDRDNNAKEDPQLQLEPNDLGHCAVPITEKSRQAKIEQFTREHGFRLTYYKQGLCAIFEEASPDGDSERTGDTNPESERKDRVSKPCTRSKWKLIPPCAVSDSSRPVGATVSVHN
jgi:hypothetical protein